MAKSGNKRKAVASADVDAGTGGNAEVEPEPENGSSSAAAGSSSAGAGRKRRRRPAPASEGERAVQPRTASDFSALELLPDELLKRIIGFLGPRETWELCRLPLVCSRMREVLASIEYEGLILRGQRVGLSRYRDVGEAELRRWAQRVRSGAMRLAPGAALEVDMRPPSRGIYRAEADKIHFSHWSPKPSKPFFSFVSSIQGLRRFVACHEDVAPNRQTVHTSTPATKTRHVYVAAVLKALAPVAGTLEELTIRLQTPHENDCRRLPQGAARKAIVEGLGRLTALRRLDLADCIGFSGKLLDEVAPALGGLRALRLAHREAEGYEEPDEYASSCRSLAFAVERLCPLLEELWAVFGCLSGSWRLFDASALASLGRLPLLRSFTVRANYRTLPEFASTRLDTLELSTPKFSQDGPGLGLLRDAALIGSLRDLTLRGGFRDWTSFASAPKLLSQLRSLSLLKAAEPNPVCLALLPRFSALERLSVGLSSFQCFTALADALPAVPALRSLFLSVSTSSHRPESNQAAGRTAVAALLRAARDTLEEYDRDHLYPSMEESGALAACTRLRRASLTLAEPAELVAAGNLHALAPLASVAARPAPARGDLVLARGLLDTSDWGAVGPLLGARWLLV
eukprot:tig00000473_g1204.t1